MVELDAATAHALFSWFDTIVVLCTGSHCAIQLAAWPTTLQPRLRLFNASEINARLGLTRANNHHHRVAAAHITVMQTAFRENPSCRTVLLLEQDAVVLPMQLRSSTWSEDDAQVANFVHGTSE